MMHCYLLLLDAVGVGTGTGPGLLGGLDGRLVVPQPSRSTLEELGPGDKSMYVGALYCTEVLVL